MIFWTTIRCITDRFDLCFLSESLTYICDHHFWSIFHELGWFGHTFLQIPADPAAARFHRCGALVEGDSALFQWVLWRVWNVGGQWGPGVSKGLNILAIPSVSVRPDGYLFLPCLMVADSDRSRSCSHGFHHRMSRRCSWIQQASWLWPFLSPGIATAASSSSAHLQPKQLCFFYVFAKIIEKT